MKLVIIEPNFVDRAWKEGANCLAKACDLVDEITGDQLKLLISRGERVLVRMDGDGVEGIGWATFRIDQLPNIRVMFITDIVAPNAHFERFFVEAKAIAMRVGASRIRCAAHDAQARLYRMKLGFKPVYSILEVEL